MAVTQINSHLVKDGSIDTADLKDGSVTLAKLAALGAKGDLLVYSGSAHAALAVGSDGQVLTADAASANGVKWAASAGGGGSTILASRLSADVGPISGTTVGTAFTVALAASTSYVFDFYVVTDASAGSAPKFRITPPTGATLNAQIIGCTSGVSTIVTGTVTNAFQSQGYGGTTVTAGSRWVRITGTVLTSSSGNLLLEFSINGVTANTVTVKVGSGYVFNQV